MVKGCGFGNEGRGGVWGGRGLDHRRMVSERKEGKGVDHKSAASVRGRGLGWRLEDFSV